MYQNLFRLYNEVNNDNSCNYIMSFIPFRNFYNTFASNKREERREKLVIIFNADSSTK